MRLTDLMDAEIVDLQKHKTQTAMQGFTDAIRGIYGGEKSFFKSGKFLPFGGTYIEKQFDGKLRPKYSMRVRFRDYRLNEPAKAVLAELKQSRFRVSRTQFGKNYKGNKEGPTAEKDDLRFEDVRQLFEQRHQSRYGAYQRSRSGFRDNPVDEWDDSGIGFSLICEGYDPRRPDKYGNPHRFEYHIIDDEADFEEIVQMEALIRRARIKSV